MSVGLLLPAQGPASAEDQVTPPLGETSAVKPEQTSDWWTAIVGESWGNKLYLGMWSEHFLDGNDDKRTRHDLVGINYHGYFLGTFLNSYDDRSWGLGLQRAMYKNRYHSLDFELGYRAGLMYGYEGTYEIGDTKLFPLFQLLADVGYGPVGVQFSWAAEAVTAGFFIKLD